MSTDNEHDHEKPPLPKLWDGDTGTLHEDSRRALLALLKGPYLSGSENPRLWTALVADREVIRSRLNDIFLDLEFDPIEEYAFTRKANAADKKVPSALRTERLKFIDTAMLLVLRQLLLAAPGERRVIIGKDEITELLSVYRTSDEVTFRKNVNASWGRMHERYRLLHKSSEERSEISPMVRFLIDENRVRNLMSVYDNLAASNDAEACSP